MGTRESTRIPLPERPRRQPGVAFSDIEATSESILYDPKTDRATVVSPLGAVVWLLCDGSRDAAAIAAEIRGRFEDRPAEAVRADVEAALGQLLAEGLIGP